MTTSLYVPLAYITVLVTSLAIFSRVYRRRQAAEKTSFDPWFPSHPSRDTYISLISSPDEVPDSLLKSALLVRATADVKRIWRLRDDKMALTILHTKGSVGDDTMARFAAAEKELEAEIVDVVSEANTFRPGWGGLIFQTASEMALAEKTRDIVMAIPRIKQQEEKKLVQRAKYLPNRPLPQSQPQIKASPPTTSTPTVVSPVKVPAPAAPAAVEETSGDSAAPSKSATNSPAGSSAGGTPKASVPSTSALDTSAEPILR
ncbi:translocation protein SEC66, partial [Tremellales sp. Uapishka_1]